MEDILVWEEDGFIMSDLTTLANSQKSSRSTRSNPARTVLDQEIKGSANLRSVEPQDLPQEWRGPDRLLKLWKEICGKQNTMLTLTLYLGGLTKAQTRMELTHQET